jgi:hypothetical protein
MNCCTSRKFGLGALVAILALGGWMRAEGQGVPPAKIKVSKGGAPIPLDELLSAGGIAAVFGPTMAVGSAGEAKRGAHDNGRGGNTFVNDPCLDPPPEEPFPENFRRTVQSENEIAVLNIQSSMGKRMVAGYNDSWGFYDNRQGLSGYAYSIDGGNTWIDGGGLPPRVNSGLPAGTEGQDAYFGDPVVVVHHASETFFYASIYQNQNGIFTLSVNRGRFAKVAPANAPPQVTASISNTRCLNDPTEYQIPDPPNQDERIYWELPVEAVLPPFLGQNNDDFLDKEWLYVDQRTGTLYLTYTRFQADGSTPIELVRCIQCAAHPEQSMVFTPPSVIVPNEAIEFNQATQAFTTPSGRVIVTWHARTFGGLNFAETAQRIEYAYSDDDGATFSPEQLVTVVNPQGEPKGYNRARATILNAPYIFVDRGADDGVHTAAERSRAGFGNVYIAYFSGRTPFPAATFAKAADIYVSTSTDNGTNFGPPVKVNDDATVTTHVFPSVQANKNGDVYVAWIDRRQDPVDNVFNDTYAAVSRTFGTTFGHNKLQTDVSTQWFVRADARPNFGDYNSSELLGFTQFVTIWSDGRFPPGTFILDRPPPATCPPLEPGTCPDPPPVEMLAATPDAIFTIANGLGVGDDPNTNR